MLTFYLFSGGTKNFEVKQTADGDKTSTTIVLMDENSILDATEDLLSEAVTESGIELPNITTTLNEELEYEEIANEILNSEFETNPKVIKKRLKNDRKIRAEDSAFLKRKNEFEAQIEIHKKDFNDEQNELKELEIELKSKQAKLELIRKEIQKYKS